MDENNKPSEDDSAGTQLQNLNSGNRLIQPPASNQGVNEPRAEPEHKPLVDQPAAYQTTYASANPTPDDAKTVVLVQDYIPGGVFLLGGLMTIPFIGYCYAKLKLLIIYGPSLMPTYTTNTTATSIITVMAIIEFISLLSIAISGVLLFAKAKSARLIAIVTLSIYLLISLKQSFDTFGIISRLSGDSPVLRMIILDTILTTALLAFGILYLSGRKVRDFLN